MQYAVVVEKEEGSDWGAYVPNLPGAGVVAKTREEVEEMIRHAIHFHLKGLREDGNEIPQPTSFAFSVEVAA